MSSLQSAAAPRERITPLAGGHNFRDIGGYPVRGNRSVAWGKVFRSGTLAMLADSDHAVLHQLGIRLICDFRSNRERSGRPSRLDPAASLVLWSRDHDESAADLLRAIAQPGGTEERSRTLMIELYRSLAYEQAESYRELFLRIAAGDLPLVFHCSAGKDRTGVAAALLLDLLGVDRATVIEDYMLTEMFFEATCRWVRDDPETNRLDAIAQDVWAPMMRVDRAYIEAMFEVIKARHGSAEGFMRDELGLDDATLDAIRTVMLTDG